MTVAFGLTRVGKQVVIQDKWPSIILPKMQEKDRKWLFAKLRQQQVTSSMPRLLSLVESLLTFLSLSWDYS